MLESAMKYGCKHQLKFEYFHIMSGIDMLLKPVDELLRFFETHKGQEFISNRPDEEAYTAYRNRTNQYRLLSKYYRGSPFSKIINTLHLEHISLAAQIVCGVSRMRYEHLTPHYGDVYCSLTNDAVGYILSKKDFIEKRYRYTSCVDELVFQTILMNSSFADKVYKSEDEAYRSSCLRYIDWKRKTVNGSPHVWTIDDKDLLLNTGNFFARKFSTALDKEIIDFLNENVK